MYRGKRKDTGEWVYGYLIGNDVIVGDIVEFNDEYFNTEYWWRVDPETVGRSTGRKDNEGNPVWEHDIFKFTSPHSFQTYYYLVQWDEENARFMSVAIKGYLQELVSSAIERGCVVAGNRFDHPHLLKGDENE